MALKSKTILGVILGTLWVLLCVGLALIPEQVPIEFKYNNKLNSYETYTFSMNDYNVIINKKVNNYNEILESKYEGILTECENGGIITFSQGTIKETALTLDINVKDVDFFGQSDTTAYKSVNGFVVLYLENEYITLTNDTFTNYSNVVGVYGSSLKIYKNPDVDIYVLKDEANISEVLYNEIYAINSNGNSNKKFFNNSSDIKSITLNNENFIADSVGTFAIDVKYGDEESVKINVCVYDNETSPDKNLIQISSQTLTYNKTEKNDVEGFLEESKLKIKFGSEENFTTVTKKMLKGLDTSRYGKQVLTIDYKNVKYRIEVIINDDNNTSPEFLKTTKYFFVKEKGDDSWIQETSLTATYLNGAQEEGILLTSEDVEIEGYDKDSIKKQIVTISYKGQETKVLVVVLEKEDFEEYLQTGVIV